MNNWTRKNDGKNDNDIREQISENGVSILYFPKLTDTNKVYHGFSTRLGGVSKGGCSSMNLSFTRENDNAENVFENYRRIAKALGVSFDSFVAAHQTHTTNIKKVGLNDKGKGVTKERDYTDIDGLITDEKGITLVTFFADCIPLYFFDPINNAIGLAHSGWRGTLNGMVTKMVKAMEENYKTNPKNLIACIGPGICEDCYEISLDLADKFKSSFDIENISDIISNYHKDKFGNEHCQLNLWKANEILMIRAGILRENISISNICTHCNSNLLFSHRKQGDDRGNLAAFLALK
jgi:conserved hypothetical protein, YfiH family